MIVLAEGRMKVSEGEGRGERREGGRAGGRAGGRQGGRAGGFLTLWLTLDTLPVATGFSKSYFPPPPHLHVAQSRNQV